MLEKKVVLEEIEQSFDLERLENLSVPGKFALVNYCGLLYKEAQYAKMAGVLKLDQSPNYASNKTYQLFAMLASNGMKFVNLKQIIVNYARNHEDSDIYYSQTVILGIGILLIEQAFEPIMIYNYLMHLLGKEFLMENQNYNGIPQIGDGGRLDFSQEIEYKPFEGNMRALKYDILGILNYRHLHSFEETVEFINNKYDNEEFLFYFNMLNVESKTVRKEIFEKFNEDESRNQRLMLAGAKAIHDELDLFSAHYLFNSIIGKYSRYDKDSKEIKNEAVERLVLIENEAVERLKIAE